MLLAESFCKEPPVRSRTVIGFSLPELLVTLAILIVFVSTALPSMLELIDHQRASAYVRQLSQYLAYARVAATSSNLPVQVCPMQQGHCSTQWRQLPIQLSVLRADNRTLLRQLDPVPAQHKLQYNRAAVTFRRDGSLNGFENGTFYYCGREGANWHFRLTLNQAGRNRLIELAQPCPI
jgi:type IV fimbrial biogenesis protein FimT